MLPPAREMPATTGRGVMRPMAVALLAFSSLGLSGCLDGQADDGGMAIADAGPPGIEIESPSSDGIARTDKGTVSLSGTAFDDTGVRKVRWQNDRGGSGSATGLYRWFIEGVRLYVGRNRIVIIVEDEVGNTTSTELMIDFQPPGDTNSPPEISGSPDGQVTVGARYDFTPAASDADGDQLSFSIVNRPAWASFDPASGRLSGMPPAGSEGLYEGIEISVSDGVLTSSLAPFSIAVVAATSAPPADANTPPEISGSAPAAATVGMSYAFRPSATDADGDALVFDVVNRPAWAGFDPATGRLAGTPQAGDEGTYTGITIGVSDGSSRVALAPFSIEVRAPANEPPMISGSPGATAVVGEAYSFTPSASDPDGDPLTFDVMNRPAWACFDRVTGRLYGTPWAGDEGVYSGITITVSDGNTEIGLPAFSIEVLAEPNEPPVISGTPARDARLDQSYAFRPTASDPDGDELTFSVTGLPAWASFDSSTGELSGTPQSGDEGTYSGIVITVSDGQEEASLGPFEIRVAATTGTVTLSWTPPTEKVDGSLLTDLAGFRIHYGRAPGQYDYVVEIADPDATSHVIEGLEAGTWYFTATAYRSTGQESGFAPEVAKEIM